MKNQRFLVAHRQPRGLRWLTLGAVALLFTLIGVLIASNLDFSPRSWAQAPTNVAETGMFPVVERQGEMESPFVAVVERVADAVVNISARTPSNETPWWFRGGHYARSSGSGFFFRDDGYILTNNHVIDDAVAITVRTSTGYEYEARLIGGDPQTDLAVLKVEPEEKVTAIPFGDSDELKVGDWAIAIGNPFPQQELDRTVTVGVISAKGRSQLSFGEETPYYQNYIQTDAAINPGNSGGPLLNLRGECIGVNAAITSPTGVSAGIGFAIPINLARAIVPDLIATGKASRGWLGVYLSDVREADAKRLKLPAVRGVMIDSVFSGSPAERAGIRKGDIVVSFDRRAVENRNQFSVLVSTVRQGDTVPIEVVRDGEHVTVNTLIGDRDSYLASAENQPSAPGEQTELLWGMEVSTFTKEIAQEIGATFVEGIYVWRVYPGTPADRASISEGSIIMKIGASSVASVSELMTAVNDSGSKASVPLIIQEPDGAIARKIIRR